MSAAPKPLTADQVLAWIANNPNALRAASADTAAEVLNGPVIQAAVDALTAAVTASQDSVLATPGQPRKAGEAGSRESLNRILAAISLAKLEVSARVEALKPSA